MWRCSTISSAIVYYLPLSDLDILIRGFYRSLYEVFSWLCIFANLPVSVSAVLYSSNRSNPLTFLFLFFGPHRSTPFLDVATIGILRSLKNATTCFISFLYLLVRGLEVLSVFKKVISCFSVGIGILYIIF